VIAGKRRKGISSSNSLVAMRTRPVQIADYRPWLELWDGYNRFYGRSGPTALPKVVTETLWERLFAPQEPVFGLVAESDSRVCGLAHCLFHRSTSAIADSCYLQDLFTAEAMRGRGIGRALVEGVRAQAQARGVSRLYWHTHETNTTAQKLYDTLAQKTGFIVYRYGG